MIGARSAPKASVASRSVGGTVAIQSRPYQTAKTQSPVSEPSSAYGRKNERQSSKPVVPRQEPPAAPAVRQPARPGRPYQVEHAHEREQARRPDLGDAVVVRRGDEVGADQAIGGRAADEERGGEQPEVARAGAFARARRGRRAPGWRRRPSRRAPAGAPPNGGMPEVRRALAQEERDDRESRAPRRRPRPGRRRASRARSMTAARSGRKTSCPVAVLAVSRPIASPRRAVNQRLTTVAPSTRATIPLPPDQRRPRPARAATAAVTWVARATPAASSASAPMRRAPDAEPLHQPAGERPHQPVEEDVDRDRRARWSSGLQPNSCSSGTIRTLGVAADAGARQQRAEGDAQDDPGVVGAAGQGGNGGPLAA